LIFGVSASANDCVDSVVIEMTCNVSSRTSNCTDWLLCLSDDADGAAESKSGGAALGPDWTNVLPIHGNKEARPCCCHYIT